MAKKLSIHLQDSDIELLKQLIVQAKQQKPRLHYSVSRNALLVEAARRGMRELRKEMGR